MTQRIFVSFMLSCTVFFFSCQPQLDFINTPTQENDSAYLKMTVLFDTSFAPGVDTSIKTVFTYDAQKRISSMLTYEYFVGQPGPELWDQTNWFYNGNDTVPYKLVRVSGSFTDPGIQSDTSFLTYTNGQISKDSIIYSQVIGSYDKQVYTYNKLGESRYYSNKKETGPGGFLAADSIHTTLTRISGNIISERDSIYTGSDLTIMDIQHTPDIHLNPYYRIALRYPVFLSDKKVVIGERQLHNDTWWLTKRLILPGPEETLEDIRFTYQYRSDGYPVVARNDDPNDFYKEIFIYTRL